MIMNTVLMFVDGRMRPPIRSVDTAVLYCLSGEFHLQAEGRKIDLTENDLFLINAGEILGWSGKPDSIFFRVSISESVLCRYLMRKNVRFILSSTEHTTKDYGEVRSLLDSLVHHSMDSDGAFFLRGVYYMLWDVLRRDYLCEEQDEGPGSSTQISEVIAYTYKEFQEPISSKSAAKKFGMTEPVFSKWFKKNTGEYFSAFLRKVRLEYARDELLRSDRSVTDIAFQSGFMNLSVFNRNFRELFQMTPRELRAQGRESGTTEQAVDMDYVKSLVEERMRSRSETVSEICRVSVDTKSSRPVSRNLADTLGPVDAAELMSGKRQEEILLLCRELHISCILVSGLFSPAIMVWNPDFEPLFRIEPANLVFDFLIKNNLTPIPVFLEEDLISTENVIIHSLTEEERVEAVRSFLFSMIARYTKETVSKWKYLIGCAPSTQWKRNEGKSTDLWRSIWKSVKALLPAAEVGAGVIRKSRNSGAFSELFRSWRSDDAIPSYLALFDDSVFRTAGRESSSGIDRHYVRECISELLGIMEEESLSEVPVWFVGFGRSYGKNSSYHDSCEKACHLLTQLSDASGIVERITCVYVSDWPFTFGKKTDPFFGGAGLLSKDGIRKPSFYALLMFSFMGDFCIARGDTYYISMRKDGYYGLLLFNPGRSPYSASHVEAAQTKPETFSHLLPDQPPLDLRITIRNMKCGKYSVSSYIYSAEQGNPLSEWIRLGRKHTLNFGEISYMNSVCVPRINYLSESVIDGTLTLRYILGVNDFHLILLAPLEE